MFTDNRNAENFQQLFEEGKKYLKLQREYVKIEITEKLVILLSTFILLLIVLILGMVALFYLSFTVAYLLAPVVGSLMASFGIIAIIHTILIIAVIAFRKRIVINPIAKFIAKLFLENEQ